MSKIMSTKLRELQDISIAELEEYGVSVRTINHFDHAGFVYITDLIDVSVDDLVRIPNVNYKIARQISNCLRLLLIDEGYFRG